MLVVEQPGCVVLEHPVGQRGSQPGSRQRFRSHPAIRRGSSDNERSIGGEQPEAKGSARLGTLKPGGKRQQRQVAARCSVSADDDQLGLGSSPVRLRT